MSSPATAMMSMRNAWRGHWPEYLIEASSLALFMVSACLVVALLEHPASPVRHAIGNSGLRRMLIGLAMGATAVAIIYSPWGKRSGAHLNPAVTLTFFRLGRIDPWDAAWYVLAQFAGGVVGVLAASWVAGMNVIADPAVNHVVTRPGGNGPGVAFAAETLMSFGLMLVVLQMTNRHVLNRYTGLIAGALVATFITFEAPISGMSMNPARSFASALPAQYWNGLWIYFTAPVLGMLLAAEVYLRTHGHGAVLCCKIHHENDERCIFRCRYDRPAIANGAADASGIRRAELTQ